MGRKGPKRTNGKLICIVGPTCTGKGRAAVELSLFLGGSDASAIVSCDSAKVYRGMDVGTGKIPPSERRGTEWHLLDVVDPADGYSAGRYAADAGRAIESIWRSGRMPILVGGTGLYFRALIDGICDAPAGAPDTRRALLARADAAEDLYAELKAIDPAAAENINPADVKRIVRALEVFYDTGKSLTEHQKRTEPAVRPDRLFVFGLDLDRADLAVKIETRVARIIAAGLEEEVRRLIETGVDPGGPALQAIGYRQTVGYLRGEYDAREWRRLIIRDTKRFAKRQRTWWRADKRVRWLTAARPVEETARAIFCAAG